MCGSQLGSLPYASPPRRLSDFIFHDFGAIFNDLSCFWSSFLCGNQLGGLSYMCLPCDHRHYNFNPSCGQSSRRGARRRIPLCGLNPACPCVQGGPPCWTALRKMPPPSGRKASKSGRRAPPDIHNACSSAPNGVPNPSQIRAESSFFPLRNPASKKAGKRWAKVCQKATKSLENPRKSSFFPIRKALLFYVRFFIVFHGKSDGLNP